MKRRDQDKGQGGKCHTVKVCNFSVVHKRRMCILAWSTGNSRRYNDRKWSDGKKRELPDDILMGILQDMGPPEAKGYDKGKGKGKEGKAKGKGKGTEKQDIAAKFEGNCSNPNCRKWGHSWTDCWKEGQDAHYKSKDRGKEKHGKNKEKSKNANSMNTGKNWNEPQQKNLQ